jgi:hypothetical protein
MCLLSTVRPEFAICRLILGKVTSTGRHFLAGLGPTCEQRELARTGCGKCLQVLERRRDIIYRKDGQRLVTANHDLKIR